MSIFDKYLVHTFLKSETVTEAIPTATWSENFVAVGLGDFTTSGDAVWARVTDEGNGDLFSAKSGAITDKQASVLTLTKITTQFSTLLKYDYKTSTEVDYDFLMVIVNDVIVKRYSGTNAWTSDSVFIHGIGSQTIKFVYWKDNSSTGGSLDTVWVDNVSLHNYEESGISNTSTLFKKDVTVDGDFVQKNGEAGFAEINLTGRLNAFDSTNKRWLRLKPTGTGGNINMWNSVGVLGYSQSLTSTSMGVTLSNPTTGVGKVIFGSSTSLPEGFLQLPSTGAQFRLGEFAGSDATKILVVNGQSLFRDEVESTAFVTTSGTASQFVKGNGTLDSNTYLTSFDITTQTDPKYLRTDVTDETNSGISTHFGTQITLSSARIQVNGFMRTGDIYLHEGGGAPTGGGLVISNIGGNLNWDSKTVLTDNNYNSYAMQANGVRTTGDASTILNNSVKPFDISAATDEPSGANDGVITTGMWDGTTYGAQQFHDFHNNTLWIRQRNASVWGAWDEVLTTKSTSVDPKYLTGTGTTNYVSKWTSTTAQGNSLIYDDGTGVGIGTTTPNAKLSISRASGFSSIKAINDGYMMIDSNGQQLRLNNYVADDVLIAMGGGNVGIGTTNPESRLHIYELGVDSPTTLILENGDVGINDTEDVHKIEFQSNDGSVNGVGVAASIRVVAENAGNIYGLAFNTQNGADRSERVRIDGTGNVGIGVVDPSAKLEVFGDIYISKNDGQVLTLGNSNYATKYITVREGANYANKWGLQANGNIDGSGTGLMISSKPLAFKAGVSSATAFEDVTAPHLKIETNGNVGIGTTDPSHKLDVVGEIHSSTNMSATAFIKSGATSSDFLLGDGTSTKLNELSQVEIGLNASVNAGFGGQIALGTDSIALGLNAIAIGTDTTSNDTETIAIGARATASDGGSIGIGKDSLATSTNSIAFGVDASVSATASYGIAIGYNAIINDAGGNYFDGIAIGRNSFISRYDAISIGRSSFVTGDKGTAIGALAEVNTTNSTAIGYAAETTDNNQVVLGNANVTEVKTTGNVVAESFECNTANDITGTDAVLKVVSCTQAEYNAGTPVATTLYVING